MSVCGIIVNSNSTIENIILDYNIGNDAELYVDFFDSDDLPINVSDLWSFVISEDKNYNNVYLELDTTNGILADENFLIIKFTLEDECFLGHKIFEIKDMTNNVTVIKGIINIQKTLI